MQRINYLKILITMVIAILIVFAAFKVDSDRKEKAKLQRILHHVEHSLRCYRSLEESLTASETPENESAAHSGTPLDSKETKDCAGPQGHENSKEMLDVVSDLLEKIQLLKERTSDEVENKANKADEKKGFHKKDVEVQLARFRKSLPFTRLWPPEFSTTAYDSLTTSGNFYPIKSLSVIEKLTELKLAQEHQESLEQTFQQTVTHELHRLLGTYEHCLSLQPENVDSEELGCSTNLIEPQFISTIENLKKITRLPLSATTRECLDKISTSSPKRDITRLNRLLLEDVYSLKPRVKQVWFAGTHTDVGGGYKENELSHIPLLWMVNEAMDFGLRIYSQHKVDLRPDATGKIHKSREGFGRLYRNRVRDWDPQQHQGKPPLLHRSVIERKRSVSDYNPWIIERDYEDEPWPVRLQQSVQFNDERIWRRPFWGWGADFDKKWENIEKIALNDTKTSFTLIMKETGPIHVEGSLPENIEAFVSRLEEKRERAHRRSVDGEFRNLSKSVERIDKDIKQKLSAMGNDSSKALAGLDVIYDDVQQLKSEVKNLEKIQD